MKKLGMLFGIGMLLLSGCGDDDIPPVVNPEEEITKVILRFENVLVPSDVVTAEWFDEDGDGGNDPEIEPIVLDASKSYEMTVQLINTFETPPEQVTEEVVEEADEHQLFFGFTNNIFSDTMGQGNISSSSGVVNYADNDENNLPLGISTLWTTGDPATGEFQVILKHQPGIKSATSTVSDGETDVDVTYQLIIQ